VPLKDREAVTTSSRLAMSWAEWGRHDATALAELVKSKQVATKELTAQAAAAVERMNPKLKAVLSLYDDVLADADRDHPSKDGRLYAVPMLLKDLGSALKERMQESGSKLFQDHVVKAEECNGGEASGCHDIAARYARALIAPVVLLPRRSAAHSCVGASSPRLSSNEAQRAVLPPSADKTAPTT